MDNNKTFSKRFGAAMARLFGEDGFPGKIAVGVSGGADSMVLLHALAEYASGVSSECDIYALSVDHCLRPEGGEEALFVRKAAEKLPNVSHHILIWEEGGQQDTRIEEAAREARYSLLFGFMEEKGIEHLFLAHHQNDQAETFLFRLAKGSGLDGLACMPGVGETYHKGQSYTLCRPLLGERKEDILIYARKKAIAYVEDPSNQNDKFARVRLRQSMGVLEKEGLSPKRLYITAKRLERARNALGYIADIEYKKSVKSRNTNSIVLHYDFLAKNPLEIVVRIIFRAMEELKGEQGGYGPRLERVETLCEDLKGVDTFRKRTLGGIIFEHKAKAGEFILSLEK